MENHLGKLILVTVVIFISLAVTWWNWVVQNAEKKDKEQQLWIDNCVRSGGKIETVGAWYANMYYVCYPKNLERKEKITKK